MRLTKLLNLHLQGMGITLQDLAVYSQRDTAEWHFLFQKEVDQYFVHDVVAMSEEVKKLKQNGEWPE